MPELTIVVPTLEERDNLAPFLAALESVLTGIEYEVIFVDDDSPDGTADLARRIAQGDHRVRILERLGRRGLSSAVLEGMMASSAPYLAVMDSDLQHDETILPSMLRKLREERLDLVVATRLSGGGSMGEMSAWRRRLSEWGRSLSAAVCRTRLSDPMSGYFVVTREYAQEAARRTSGTGFKVLLDLVVSARHPPRFAEIPYRFRPRRHGQSKLDVVVAVEYLELLADKLVGDFVPASYVVFGCAGAVGVVVHLAIVRLLRRAPGFTLDQAQFTSSAIVIGVNFLLNNRWTFRSARLRGQRLVAGLALFYAACSVGLFLNLRVLNHLAGLSVPWYAAAVAGLAVGSVWNYWMSAMFVWQVRRRASRSPMASTRAQASEQRL
ncbi:MAG TPA: glycosyltransferase family 2 protein [Bryobacteraceae bacterium]|nr:glycosyltransferase family 2 protein [Bryobacteraceae bacterium]